MIQETTSSAPLRRVLIMAGGTGGHVIPALSLAEALTRRGVQVEWLGSPRGIENRLVPEAGLVLHRIAVAGLRGNGMTGWLKAPWRLWRAVAQAKRVLASFDPQLVVGLGGFASGPGGLAAWLGGRPLIVHEQNAIAGLTNQVLARLAWRAYAAFPGAFRKLGSRREAIVIGNPVRPAIARLGETLRDPEAMQGRRLRVLVVGGSLGAVALNQLLPEALAKLPEAQRPEVRHQAGRERRETTEQGYREAGVDARVSEFIDDMAEAYAWADLVVCRSGALTVSELAAAAKPALLVPFPHAVDDHQTRNADYLVEAGAARLLPQATLNATSLAAVLDEVLNPQLLATMAGAARSRARLDAVDRLVEGCMEAARER